jgi:hypothetical protein
MVIQRYTQREVATRMDLFVRIKGEFNSLLLIILHLIVSVQTRWLTSTSILSVLNNQLILDLYLITALFTYFTFLYKYK